MYEDGEEPDVILNVTAQANGMVIDEDEDLGDSECWARTSRPGCHELVLPISCFGSITTHFEFLVSFLNCIYDGVHIIFTVLILLAAWSALVTGGLDAQP